MSEENAEARLTRPADDYEEKFMGVGEKVVYRDKMSMHPAFQALIFTIFTGATVALALTGAPPTVTVLPLLVGFIAFMGTLTLRTTVSEENVHIQYGVIGPSIPIESIKSVKPVKYSWLKYGGWGIRFSIFDGSWAYNMIGDKGRAVELEYEKKGRTKKLIVASKEPALLADSIQLARQNLETETGVRLEFSDGDDVGAPSEESAEVESEAVDEEVTR